VADLLGGVPVEIALFVLLGVEWRRRQGAAQRTHPHPGLGQRPRRGRALRGGTDPVPVRLAASGRLARAGYPSG